MTRSTALAALLAAACYADAGSVLDLQHGAQHQRARAADGRELQLTVLNPTVGAQAVLRVGQRRYHLQTAPGTRLELTASGLRHRRGDGPPQDCELFGPADAALRPAEQVSYLTLCSGAVFVRRTLNGYKPGIAAHAERLRAWGSWTEDLINAYKSARAGLGLVGDSATRGAGAAPAPASGVPAPAQVDPAFAGMTLAAERLGIAVRGAERLDMPVGRWLPARHHDGVYVSILTPELVAPELLASHPDRVHDLHANHGSAQARNLAYLVAFELDRYTLGWMHGTEHPGVGWSARAVVDRHHPQGPDGFETLTPLAPVGAVSPVDLPRTVATFSGGFQRRHAAFRRGERARTRNGHHYGFVEDGVVLSSLVASLATITVDVDGHTELLTWTEAHDVHGGRLRYARQNGVPLIEGGGPDSSGIPGELVRYWVRGNWSGSADRQLMTPRSAACLVDEDGRRLLVYGYFSGHTPSGMVRVLQAYRCDYAVHLDMNSPGQAYFALFDTTGDDPLGYRVEHLVEAMRSVDAWVGNRRTPRYLLKADYKDFFFVRRRD